MVPAECRATALGRGVRSYTCKYRPTVQGEASHHASRWPACPGPRRCLPRRGHRRIEEAGTLLPVWRCRDAYVDGELTPGGGRFFWPIAVEGLSLSVPPKPALLLALLSFMHTRPMMGRCLVRAKCSPSASAALASRPRTVHTVRGGGWPPASQPGRRQPSPPSLPRSWRPQWCPVRIGGQRQRPPSLLHQRPAEKLQWSPLLPWRVRWRWRLR